MPIDQMPTPPPPAVAHLAAALPSQSVIGRALLRAGFRAVPLRASSVGHFHLSGAIDGKPVEILLDTGASNTVVDQAWARQSGYALTSIAGSAGGIGAAGLGLATVDHAELTIGDVSLGQVRLIAIDLGGIQSQLRASNIAVPQAVLGADTLRRHRAVIDYATATLWVAPPPRPAQSRSGAPKGK